jgi:hypothetical protein
VTRDQYLAEIEELTKQQETIWTGGLAKFVAMRSCELGLCGQIDTLDRLAREATTLSAKGEAEQKAAAERATRQVNWLMVAREIEQIEIAKSVLRKRADGVLR